MISALTLLGYLVLGAGYAFHFLMPQHSAWVAPFSAVLSWMIFLILAKKITWQIHVIGLLLSTLSAGLLMDLEHPAYPLYTLLMLAVFTATFLRSLLFTRLGYLRFYRMELIGMTTAFVLYPVVNLINHASWEGWAVPSLNLAFAILYNMDSGKELKMWQRNAKEEYKAAIGMPAPDFTLVDDQGESFTLSENKERNPVLLLFVRGDWCPSCHIMLRVYERNNDEFRRRNVTVVAIGPDPQGVNKTMVQKLSLNYRILADEKMEALGLYGITYRGNSHGQTYEVGSPLPASILIDRNGIIRHICRADRAGEFLNPMQIFAVLEKITA